MSRLDELLAYNKQFVENKEYEAYKTTKFPDKKMVILTCMDTRLIELLPKSLNLKNGDAKIIKNAGAIISNPFGSAMRSIIVSLYALKAEEVYVIAHHSCGMCELDSSVIVEGMKKDGIDEVVFKTLETSGIDVNKWLHGFDSVEDSVKNSVKMIKEHPLLPSYAKVHGLIIHPETGALDLVVDDN